MHRVPLLRIAIITVLLWQATFCPAAAHAQLSGGAGRLVVVFPFENLSKAPGIDWIGEAFPEVLGQRFAAAQFYVVSRPERLYALDRLGIPANTHPSRATLLRIAEEMDVDYLITGTYTFDGKSFTSHARLMDVKKLHLSPDSVESGALVQLVDIQDALAWDLLRSALPNFSASKASFTTPPEGMRLDALENYVRGLLATERADKIKYLKEAVRLNPEYAQPMLQLGKLYYETKEYEAVIAWLDKVPKKDPTAAEANFYLGLSAFYTAKFERASQAFGITAAAVPLIEVYNNLGVVAARLGKASATDLFQRAVEADGRDPDYRFNLAVALYRNGDFAGAARQLRDCLALRPQDAEAKSLLDLANARATNADTEAATRVPLERIKRNYDESSYRQLALEIQNANEVRYAQLPPPERAAHHVLNGNELWSRGFGEQAENDFRQAILLDPTNPGAHLGLARIMASRNEFLQARTEAVAANRLQPSAVACVLLAQIELKQGKPESALEYTGQALRLEPANEQALAMQREIAAQAANKVRGSEATKNAK